MAAQAHTGFQPPAYIAGLIASINDGARAAQTGGLFMLAIAVYLMATVISTTDEVLLRGTFVNFQQIGVQVPVVASYALAPLVFLFLYVHTLIRYDMLAENLRLLDRELRTSLPLEADRDRCRQLLANVEFVQYWIAPKGSPWHSRVYRVLVWVMLVAIPILVFLATQISFLRYQSAFVTYVIHLGSLAAALTAITYFWYRQARRRQDWRPLDRRGKARTLARTGWLAVAVLVLAAAYFRIPPPDSTTAGRINSYVYSQKIHHGVEVWQKAVDDFNITKFLSAPQSLAADLWDFHPLDLIVCPDFDWGCRFLRLDHRLLIQEKPDGDVLFKLRTGDGDLRNLLFRVEALFLRDRSFRFADFSDSEFYDADLVGVDLRGAFLGPAKMQGANLSGAQLQGAYLTGAKMQGAHLTGAKMQGVDLSGAQLQGVDLSNAKMQGADLSDAQLQSVDLSNAKMQGADLSDAQLQGVDLSNAKMQGANLSDAQLQGAHLWDTHLQGADLRKARLWQARFDQNSNLSQSDLRGVDLPPITADRLSKILKSLEGVPEDRRRGLIAQVREALTPWSSPPPLPTVRIEVGKPALVDAEQPGFDEKPNSFVAFGVGLTTDNEAAYDAALAPFLTGLARDDAYVARAIARRALSWQSRSDAKRRLWPDLAQRLLAAEKEGAFSLDLAPEKRKALEDLAAKAPPPGEGVR